MKLKLAPGLAVKKSKINGRGCFSTAFFPKGRKVAEYAGERITSSEGERRLRTRAKHRICALDEDWSVDGSRGGNGTHYLNHSCEPNTYMRTTHGHLLFMALPPFTPAKKITCDYIPHYTPTHTNAAARRPKCRGTINRK